MHRWLLLALIACGSTPPAPVANTAPSALDRCGCWTPACRRRDVAAWFVALECETSRRICACDTGACVVTVDRWKSDQVKQWTADDPGAASWLVPGDVEAKIDPYMKAATTCAGKVRDPMGAD